MRRHDTDVMSLVFGLVFLGVAALWALVQGELLSLPDLSVLGPVILVVAGLIGIAVTLSRGNRRARENGAEGSSTAVDRRAR